MIFKSKQRIPNRDIEFKGAWVQHPSTKTKSFYTSDPFPCVLLANHLYTFEFNDETFTMTAHDDIFYKPGDVVIQPPPGMRN
jgi:hypothetical protein